MKSSQEDKEDDRIINNLRNKIDKIPQSLAEIENKKQKYNQKKNSQNYTRNLKKVKLTENKQPLAKLDYKTQELKRKRPNKKAILDIKSRINNNMESHDNDHYKIILKLNE